MKKERRGRPKGSLGKSRDPKYGRFLKDKEMAERMGWTEQYVRDCRSQGKPLPAYIKTGRLVRTSELAIRQFIEEHTVDNCA